jgi:hypothetical protein
VTDNILKWKQALDSAEIGEKEDLEQVHMLKKRGS